MFEKIEKLINEYVETLDDERESEWLETNKGFAEVILREFKEWLEQQGDE